MKAFLALVCLLSLSSAFAQYSTEIKSGDLSLSQAKAEIEKVSVVCPSTDGGIRCMAYGSTITVKVTLNGCVDRLGGYFSDFEVVNGKGVLKFAAINIFNKTSMVARCIKIPTEYVKISVPFEGEIELIEMPYTGTKTDAADQI